MCRMMRRIRRRNRIAYYELAWDIKIRIATDGGDAVPFSFQKRLCDQEM
jgi:hypothetical protein